MGVRGGFPSIKRGSRSFRDLMGMAGVCYYFGAVSVSPNPHFEATSTTAFSLFGRNHLPEVDINKLHSQAEKHPMLFGETLPASCH